MATGLPLRRVGEPVAEKTASQMAYAPDAAKTHFAALRRMLDREAPDYLQ